MSDKMRGIPFKILLETTVLEYRTRKSLYYVPMHDELAAGKMMLAGKPLSVPVGPAAGPHTQLAQNLLAGFAAGARVFELKTVQIMEGEELGIVNRVFMSMTRLIIYSMVHRADRQRGYRGVH